VHTVYILLRDEIPRDAIRHPVVGHAGMLKRGPEGVCLMHGTRAVMQKKSLSGIILGICPFRTMDKLHAKKNQVTSNPDAFRIYLFLL